MARDYYNILEIGKDASENDIKKAYRKLAKKYHPDRNPGDEEAELKMAEVNEAHEVLIDPEKRKLYDQYGHDWEKVSQMGGMGGMGDINDLFEQMHRQHFGGRQPRQPKGEAVIIEMNLTLEECFNGCTKEVSYRYAENCVSCKGNGSKGGTAFHTCSTCGGAGVKRVVQRLGGINLQETVPCSACKTKGYIVDEDCPDCSGGGMRLVNQEVSITFPRGIAGGQQLKEAGRGHHSAHPQGIPGDLVFVIKEKPHPIYERYGKDLVHKYPINYEDLVLGTKIKVPTIGGRTTSITVKPGTQNGKHYKIKGFGMPHIKLPISYKQGSAPDGAFGNFIVELQINIPETHNEEELELLRKLKDLRGENLDKVS